MDKRGSQEPSRRRKNSGKVSREEFLIRAGRAGLALAAPTLGTVAYVSDMLGNGATEPDPPPPTEAPKPATAPKPPGPETAYRAPVAPSPKPESKPGPLKPPEGMRQRTAEEVAQPILGIANRIINRSVLAGLAASEAQITPDQIRMLELNEPSYASRSSAPTTGNTETQYTGTVDQKLYSAGPLPPVRLERVRIVFFPDGTWAMDFDGKADLIKIPEAGRPEVVKETQGNDAGKWVAKMQTKKLGEVIPAFLKLDGQYQETFYGEDDHTKSKASDGVVVIGTENTDGLHVRTFINKAGEWQLSVRQAPKFPPKP